MSRGRLMQDRLARRLAEIVSEREPRSGFPRPTLLPIPEGCAIVSDVEVTIDVTVSPEVAEAMLRAMAGARPSTEAAATHEGPLKYVTKVEEAAEGRGEDRLGVVRLSDRTIFVVADGAGGAVGGVAAAEAVCDAVVEQCGRAVPAPPGSSGSRSSTARCRARGSRRPSSLRWVTTAASSARALVTARRGSSRTALRPS